MGLYSDDPNTLGTEQTLEFLSKINSSALSTERSALSSAVITLCLHIALCVSVHAHESATASAEKYVETWKWASAFAWEHMQEAFCMCERGHIYVYKLVFMWEYIHVHVCNFVLVWERGKESIVKLFEPVWRSGLPKVICFFSLESVK